MRWLFAGHEYIEHLKAEITYLRLELKHERQRAELALDRLLESKTGTRPITPPEPETPDDRLQKEMEALMNNPEFTEAGQA